MDNSRIGICGLHRSGTTFVGELVKRAGTCVIHEPLNERFGMARVPIAYPYCAEVGGRFAALLDDAVDAGRPWRKEVAHVRTRGLRRAVYRITGGRSGIRWGWLRLRRAAGMPHPRVCIKDPFISLATPYLVQQRRMKVVCLVRHPAAIHYSTRKQGWAFDVENLLRQSEMIERHGADIPEAHWQLARAHDAASIAILWKVMVRINMRLARDDKRLAMITHESLCTDPAGIAGSICDHFGIPFTPGLEQFVREHSEGARVEGASGKVHDFTRNSRGIPDAWRNKLSQDEERMILEISGKEIAEVYGRA